MSECNPSYLIPLDFSGRLKRNTNDNAAMATKALMMSWLDLLLWEKDVL